MYAPQPLCQLQLHQIATPRVFFEQQLKRCFLLPNFRNLFCKVNLKTISHFPPRHLVRGALRDARHLLRLQLREQRPKKAEEQA